MKILPPRWLSSFHFSGFVVTCLALFFFIHANALAEEGSGETADSEGGDAPAQEVSPEQRAENADKVRAEARERIIALIENGAEATVEIPVFGRMSLVEATGASEDGLEFDFDGELLEQAWDELSDKALGTLLFGLAGKDGEAGDLARAGILLRLGGDDEEGERIIRAAVSKDAASAALKTSVFGPERKRLELIGSSKASGSDSVRGKAPAGAPPGAWTPTGMSGGGSMYRSAISGVDPDLMIINCDMGGQYISRDGGHHWKLIHFKKLRTNTNCYQAFHPRDVNIIYAADGQLKISRDCGETWTPIGNLPGRPEGRIGIDPDNPDFMLVGSGGGVFRSDNAGAGWMRCEGPEGGMIDCHFDRTVPGACFVATKTGIWRSDDGAESWVKKTEGLPYSEILSFYGGSKKVGKKKEVRLYCTLPSRVRDGKLTGGVYASFDRGETWQSAMGNGINVSTEQKNQWAMAPLPTYPFVRTTDKAPEIVYAVCWGNGFKPPYHTTVYRSNDAGKTWKSVFYADRRFSQCNLKMSWRPAFAGQYYFEDHFGASICPSDPNRLMIHRGRCEITHDGGKTWFSGHSEHKPGSAEKGEDSEWLNTGLVVTSAWHYYIDPFEKNRHYICYTDICFARSIDSGKSWKWYDWRKFVPWRNTTYELAFDPDIPGKIWGAFSNVHDIPNDNIISGRHNSEGPGGPGISTDFGVSWKACNDGLPVKPCTTIVLDSKSPKNNRTLYTGIFGEGVFKSTDDGKHWVKKSAGLGAPSNMRVYRLILHADGKLFCLITAKRGGNGFLKGGAGLYRSGDGAESWEKITEGMDFRWPKDFAVDPENSNVIYLGNTRSDGADPGLYKTIDGGKTWRRVAFKASQHFGAYFHPFRKGWVYMTLCENDNVPCLWLSKDDGNTWQPFETLPFPDVQRVYVDPGNANRIFVTTFGGSVWVGPAEPVSP